VSPLAHPGVTTAMAFNPFTYCRNSPLVFTDPDGNFFFLIPIIAGAVIGAYMGGTLANNGNLNPFQWNYNAKTFGYMAIGGLIGGVSTGIGLAAASGASAGMTAMGFASGSILNMAVTGAVGAGMTALWNSAGMQALAGVNDPGKGFSSVGFAALTGGVLGALGGLGGLDPGAFNPETATPFQEALMGSALAAGTTGASALGQAAAQAFSPVAKTMNDAVAHDAAREKAMQILYNNDPGQTGDLIAGDKNFIGRTANEVNNAAKWTYNNILKDGALEGNTDGANTAAGGQQAPLPLKILAEVNPLVSIPSSVMSFASGQNIYTENVKGLNRWVLSPISAYSGAKFFQTGIITTKSFLIDNWISRPDELLFGH